MNGTSKPITPADIVTLLGTNMVQGIDYVFLANIDPITKQLDDALAQGQVWGVIKPPAGEQSITLEQDFDFAYVLFLARQNPSGQSTWEGDVEVVVRAHNTQNMDKYEVTGPAANSFDTAIGMSELTTVAPIDWTKKLETKRVVWKKKLGK